MDSDFPEIRLMTENDIPGYHACLDAVARERRYLHLLEAPPLEKSRDWALPHIQQNHPFFVAAMGTEVVGWCDITPNTREGFSHRGVLGIGIRREFRRRGIGTRLLRAAIAHAQKIGLERIELDVFASNTVAKQLYERMGFVEEGALRRARKCDGCYEDIFMMALFTKDRTPN